MRTIAEHDPRQIFLRREAIALGYSDADLRRALRAEDLVRIRHGAYTSAPLWSAADPRERHRLRCRAVLATHGAPVALSHTSAAIMQGLDVWGTDLTRVHVTRLDGLTERLARDITYHRGAVPEHDLEDVATGGLMTCAHRAGLEHASIVGVESGLVTLDSFLRHSGPAGVAMLDRARVDLRSWPGARRLQVTLRLARPGAESVGESRLRFLCWQFHLPEPELQFEVRDPAGVFVARTDFAWPGRRALGEFDGRTKYGELLRPGEKPSDALFREKIREDRIREITGFTMIRFVWSDLASRTATAERIRRALRLR